MELIVQKRAEAECIAMERYYQMLRNCVQVAGVAYLYGGDAIFTDVPAEVVVRILKTDETDVIRYSDRSYIDPLYSAEIVSVIKYDRTADYAPFLFIGAKAEIYGESIQVLGD